VLNVYFLIFLITIEIIFLSSLTGHILKNGKFLKKEKGFYKIFSKVYNFFMIFLSVIMTALMKLTLYCVDSDWWWKGPFRRLIPWFLANYIVKITYAGEVYTTEETVAMLENIYKKADENGKHLHISISPCICRHAANNWSTEMPNLTCIHLNLAAQPAKKNFDQTLLISAETAIFLVKDYASKWPFVHIIYGLCPSSPEYFDKQVALCFCHHHCATMRCEIKRGKYGVHPIKKADHLAVINENLCTNCGICYEKCPFFAINKLKDNKFKINHDQCFGCGVCKRFCPNDAIKLVDRPKSQENFIKKEVLKIKSN